MRVFENVVLREIFGPKRNGVTGELRKLHNVELNNLYCSQYILLEIKSRRMRWARHVARMGDWRDVYRALGGNLMERDHWGDPRLDVRIILI
jgi:hypothetical protein